MRTKLSFSGSDRLWGWMSPKSLADRFSNRAGSFIKSMQIFSYMDVYKTDFINAAWDRLAAFRKPTIAAVARYALGGGFEFAMMCNFIIAADTAKFGQPKITIGTIPGCGGTQRLARFIGKSKARDMILTGRMMDADGAERLAHCSARYGYDDRLCHLSFPILKK